MTDDTSGGEERYGPETYGDLNADVYDAGIYDGIYDLDVTLRRQIEQLPLAS